MGVDWMQPGQRVLNVAREGSVARHAKVLWSQQVQHFGTSLHVKSPSQVAEGSANRTTQIVANALFQAMAPVSVPSTERTMTRELAKMF